MVPGKMNPADIGTKLDSSVTDVLQLTLHNGLLASDTEAQSDSFVAN